MKTKLILAAAMFAFTVPAHAQVILEMSQITCGQYLKLPPDQEALVDAWMGGYFGSSRNLTMIDSRYVKRNTEVVDRFCKEHKETPLLDAVMKEFH